jgi:hypothetical protein
MPLTFNPNLWPDGGWHFIDANGVKHTGNSFSILVKTVTTYRMRAGQPAGDPPQEITVQLCGRNSGFCKDSHPAHIPTTDPMADSLLLKVQKFISWLVNEKRLGHVQLIDRNVALARANICARCPRQRDIPTTCGSCKTNIVNGRRAVLGGKDPVHAGIQICSALEEDVALVVHLAVPQRHDANLPAECWRRNC